MVGAAVGSQAGVSDIPPRLPALGTLRVLDFLQFPDHACSLQFSVVVSQHRIVSVLRVTACFV